MDKRDYEKQWPGLPIKYLIIASAKYIIFIDHDNDIDWKTSDEFDKQSKTQTEKCEYYSVKNQIDSAECTPINHLDEKVIIAFKRQLGEALVRAFERDFENAQNMVMRAQDYIIKRNIEQSRYMFLKSCTVTAISTFAISIIFWLFREQIILSIGNTTFYITLSMLIGSLGALLSVISRMGNTNLDYNASKNLHYMEGSSRVLAGCISALIVAISIKTGILLPIFSKIESTNLGMLLGGLIAGASERFAPSIINKLDGLKTFNK